MTFILTEENVAAYLAKHDITTEEGSVKKLSGGFVNALFRFTSKTQDIVLKQTFAKSHFSEEFGAGVERSQYEGAAMELIHKLLGKDALVPELLLHDPDNFIIVMSAIPEGAVLYQDELIQGNFHKEIAQKMGLFTARLHNATHNNSEVKKQFFQNPGYQLRHDAIATAFHKHPEYEKKFKEMLAKNLQNRICLVDADITPKNMLLHDGTFTHFDLEMIQMGDPAHEVGISLSVFYLLMLVHPKWKKDYVDCAKAYWNAYQETIGFSLSDSFVSDMKNYLAMLMIGRVDAIFTLGWLKGYEDQVRKAALTLFDTDVNNLDDIFKIITQ